MIFPSRYEQILSSLGIIILLTLTIVTPGLARDDSRAKDRAERSVEREKRFLFRAVEDLDQSLSHVSEIMKGLDRQIEGIQLLESLRREDDLRLLLDWYYNYASWLTEYRMQFDTDLTDALTGERGPKGWVDRYHTMAQGYARLAGDLQNIVNRLEYDKTEIDRRIFDLRARLSYLTAYRDGERHPGDRDNNDRSRDKDRRDQERADKEKDDRERELRALESAQLIREIQAYENLLIHLGVLTEVGKYEMIWIDSRTADCAVLDEVARAIGSSGRISRNDVYTMIIRQYESDSTSFQRKIDEIDRKLSRIIGSGTLQTLNRQEELSVYYLKIKRRYEYHITWLSQQIGAYRAEQTGI